MAGSAVRLIYSAVLYALIPFVLLRLLARGRRAPAYLRRWNERFGFYRGARVTEVLWFHAVSVGEAEAAFPLIRAIRERFPQAPLLITTTTPTGSARVQATFGDAVHHVYLPYDLPGSVRRFFRRFRPGLAVVLETEIWPNLFHHCRRRHIPLALVNARISERSLRGYKRLGGLIRATLAAVAAIAAQTAKDAARFIELGADPKRVTVTGNVKFDRELPASLFEQAEAMRTGYFRHRPVWIAGSTHEGEDELILAVCKKVRQKIPRALLVVAPRHPERFARTAALARQAGYSVIRRSTRDANVSTADVFVLDTLGELTLFYAACDVAFVGGSLVPAGGHNMLEPAAAGVPVLFGPHTANFEEIARGLVEAGAAVRAPDAEALTREIIDLLEHAERRSQMGENGRAFIRRNRGAMETVADGLAALYRGDR